MCFGVVGLLVTLFLIGSLAALLAGKAPAPKAVKTACGVASVVAVLEGIFVAYSQYALSGAMKGMMDGLPQGAAAAEGIMGASMALGVCWGLVWMSIKLAYYIGTVFYLSKEDVLRDYAAAASAPVGVRGE